MRQRHRRSWRRHPATKALLAGRDYQFPGDYLKLQRGENGESGQRSRTESQSCWPAPPSRAASCFEDGARPRALFNILTGSPTATIGSPRADGDQRPESAARARSAIAGSNGSEAKQDDIRKTGCLRTSKGRSRPETHIGNRTMIRQRGLSTSAGATSSRIAGRNPLAPSLRIARKPPGGVDPLN